MEVQTHYTIWENHKDILQRIGYTWHKGTEKYIQKYGVWGQIKDEVKIGAHRVEQYLHLTRQLLWKVKRMNIYNK